MINSFHLAEPTVADSQTFRPMENERRAMKSAYTCLKEL